LFVRPQTIFFWILLVRQILRYYDAHPQKRPTPNLKLYTHNTENFFGSHSLEISEQEQEQICEIFELFDTDGSGKINNFEIDAAMFALGFKRSSVVNAAAGTKNTLNGGSLVLDTISEDGSRSISLEAFTVLMKGESIGSTPLEGIWSAFATISQNTNTSKRLSGAGTEHDGWGSVTLEGLRCACREYDVRLTEDELVSMMKDADVDGNGVVDKTEFLNIMRHAPWF
jgi:Ca2+-binding EF-hand superfamily protein